ncbi:MAG: hypothetical protein E4H19_16265 [Chromatiales bacterium]|nr:MAG: hypothetical protein E4H19_16265 [Chromatiales bacterium]
MTVIRIVGLMRSGTNLLTWMLRQNFVAVSTATMLLGWKHGPIIRDRLALSIDDYVDPRYRGELHRFVSDHPDEWARVTASSLYRQAVEQQRAQSFGVALAVRDPGLWYASCLRIHQQVPEFLLHGISPAEASAFWNASHRDWLETLGESSVIVDTDALRKDPGAILNRLAAGLQIRRTALVREPQGYLHPRSMEEIYELLGAPVSRAMEREFTTPGHIDPRLGAEFNALLDRGLLDRLGLA